MPEGIVRSDPNNGGTSYKKGSPVSLPITYGTPVTLPQDLGNPVPPVDPTFNSNPVTWTPSSAHFGNTGESV